MTLFIGSFPVRFLLLAAVCWLGVVMAEASVAEAQSADQVKAAFLFNFAKFVEWPPEAFSEDPSTIRLGILEGEPLTQAIEALEGKVVQERRVAVQKCRTAHQAKKCQIFFASASERLALTRILASLRSSPVLVVTDQLDNYSSLGGIINLIIVEDKIRFEIDVDNARNAQLKISSQLLKLARHASN